MYKRLLVWLLLLVPGAAWDTLPHQKITKAALDAAPREFVDRLGPEAGLLAEIYCLYPDRYLEMEHYNFVRSSPGPRTAAEIRAYCVRPDGEAIHGISGDRRSDLQSLVFLLEHMVLHLRQKRPQEAARYAGVLAHFVEDSLSPPHAVSAERLREMAPEHGQLRLHSILERSVPDFRLERPYRPARVAVPEAAEAVLRACYTGADRNRADLRSMLRLAVAGDEKSLDVYRLRAATRAAEILAGAFAQCGGIL